MLKDELSKQIIESLKSGNSVRVSTLRLLASALHNEEIAKQSQLSNDDEVVIIKRQLKQREEAVEAYEKAGRIESAEKERAEGEILKEFLPEQIGESELSDIVNKAVEESGAHSMSDFGKVMSAVMAKVKGQADGKLTSELVRAKLSAG